MSAEECRACRFWKVATLPSGKQDPHYGLCRHRSPTSVVIAQGDYPKFATRFPITQAVAWCGDFQGQAAEIPNGEP